MGQNGSGFSQENLESALVQVRGAREQLLSIARWREVLSSVHASIVIDSDCVRRESVSEGGNLRCALLSVADACAGPCLAPAAALAARLWTPMFVEQEALESVLNSATSAQSTSS